MPAIPLVVMGVQAGLGAYSAHKQSQQAGQAADMQKSILDRQSALANSLTTLGQGQMSASKPALDAAMKYYLTGAQGNRAQLSTMLAPQMAGIAETARGTQRGLEAHMGPGAQRDEAIADLARQRQGSMNLLPMQARNDAVGKLAAMGEQGMSRGAGLIGQASGVLNGQQSGVNSIFGLQQEGQQGWHQLGQDMFRTFGDYLMKQGRGGKSSQPGPWAGGYQF